MPTRKEMLEQIRETEELLAEARDLLARIDPPDDELLRMLRVADECLDELRRCVPPPARARTRRPTRSIPSH